MKDNGIVVSGRLWCGHYLAAETDGERRIVSTPTKVASMADMVMALELSAPMSACQRCRAAAEAWAEAIQGEWPWSREDLPPSFHAAATRIWREQIRRGNYQAAIVASGSYGGYTVYDLRVYGRERGGTPYLTGGCGCWPITMWSGYGPPLYVNRIVEQINLRCPDTLEEVDAIFEAVPRSRGPAAHDSDRIAERVEQRMERWHRERVAERQQESYRGQDW